MKTLNSAEAKKIALDIFAKTDLVCLTKIYN